MKECVDCYEIIEAMGERKGMEEDEVETVIKIIRKSRYLLGELSELY